MRAIISCDAAFWPMPQTAPPAKPAPACVTSSRASAGTILTLGAPCRSTNWTRRYSTPSCCSWALSALRFTVNLPQPGDRMGIIADFSGCKRRLVQREGIMCGIVGFLDKRGGTDRPVGQTILTLLQALSCRGPDSAGVALFDSQDEWRVRVSVLGDRDPDATAAALCALGVVVQRHYRNGVYD